MRICILLTVIIILFVGSFGCSDSGVEEMKNELEAANLEAERTKNELEAANQRIREIDLSLKEKSENLEKVNSENIRLSANYSTLQDDFNTLKIKCNSLSIKYEELDIWSKKLADGYGAGIWYMDESDRPVFFKSIENADTKAVVEDLNEKFRKESLPEIVLKNIVDKTAYIGTDNDEMLTQRMGSFGARAYIRAVTYSITSVKDIDCILLDIKEGDHALPGEYCR
jgi:hypothetical protein